MSKTLSETPSQQMGEKKMSEKSNKLTVCLDDSTFDGVRILSNSSGLSMSGFTSRILADFVTRHEDIVSECLSSELNVRNRLNLDMDLGVDAEFEVDIEDSLEVLREEMHEESDEAKGYFCINDRERRPRDVYAVILEGCVHWIVTCDEDIPSVRNIVRSMATHGMVSNNMAGGKSWSLTDLGRRELL